MKIKDIMSKSVDSIDSTNTIADAARRMAENDLGALPILSDGKLVGIVTDRDIAVRGVAAGISTDAPVRRVMSENVDTCSPEDSIETVLALMSREQIRRMPVCNGRDEVVGMVALADLAKHDPDKKEVTEALADICEPSGLHCQAPVFA
ncbi:CBS domain-containing protein [Sphingomonas sp.]|uniref:CBS domain-containing protein n=1 Tax=Sphingomonas sp. TaxID=28214 RepID=UPI00286AA13B|nr:CBS domain-containing protein [Sphingomonas sp.]